MIFVVVAVLLALWGVVQLFAGDVLWGVLLLVLACAVGPGGWSLFDNRR